MHQNQTKQQLQLNLDTPFASWEKCLFWGALVRCWMAACLVCWGKEGTSVEGVASPLQSLTACSFLPLLQGWLRDDVLPKSVLAFENLFLTSNSWVR